MELVELDMVETMSEDKIEDNTVYYGEVIWFDPKKGYGFVSWKIEEIQQRDIFCHFSDLVMSNFKTLYKGQRVSFSIGTNRHGDPKAINVTVLKN
jgi:CspA family cold shock protein